jgi:hypothetical protein
VAQNEGKRYGKVSPKPFIIGAADAGSFNLQQRLVFTYGRDG